MITATNLDNTLATWGVARLHRATWLMLYNGSCRDTSYYITCSGPPLAPPVSLNTYYNVNDTFTFNLTWSTPFTWPGFPVLNYKVVKTSYSSGEPVNETIVIESNDFRNTTRYYHMEFLGRVNGCYNLSFSVEASNSIGKGEATVLESGQPLGKASRNTNSDYMHLCYLRYLF